MNSFLQWENMYRMSFVVEVWIVKINKIWRSDKCNFFFHPSSPHHMPQSIFNGGAWIKISPPNTLFKRICITKDVWRVQHYLISNDAYYAHNFFAIPRVTIFHLGPLLLTRWHLIILCTILTHKTAWKGELCAVHYHFQINRITKE